MLAFKVSKRDKKIVWILSSAIGLALATTIILNYLVWKVPLIFQTDQLIFFALIIAIFSPAAVNYIDMRYKQNIDKNIPEFLRELSEAGRTGITLTRAITLASKRKYGALSKELDKISVKLSWGGSLDEALIEFANSVETKLARRTAILISEINKSGGDIRDVLEMVSRHIGELQSIDEEREGELKNYISIIYFAYFLFLFIDILLLKTFFEKLESLKEVMSETGGFFLSGGIGLDSIKTVMFHMSAVQGFVGGLIAGKMGEGSVGAGLKHSLIMMGISFLIFLILVWR